MSHVMQDQGHRMGTYFSPNLLCLPLKIVGLAPLATYRQPLVDGQLNAMQCLIE